MLSEVVCPRFPCEFSGCIAPEHAYYPPMHAFLANIPGLFGTEGLIIFLVILLLFGAKKIPELARGVGKAMGEFKKAREEFEHEVTRSSDTVQTKPAPGNEPVVTKEPPREG